MTIRVGDPLTLEDVARVASERAQVEVAPGVQDRMASARRVIEDVVAAGTTVYGVTTGFGALANVRIDPSEALALQRDIILSHATAIGPALPTEIVRAMLLLKARTLAFGASGVRFELVALLVEMLNKGVHPVVPSQGSLGASGDLAPLAHLALPVIGEGRAEVGGRVLDGAEAMRSAGLTPIEPSYKEGLALVNGTEMMLGLGIVGLLATKTLAAAADITGAMTLEACLGTDRAFDPDLVGLRKHPGALVVADNLRRLLADSEIVASHRESEHLVQDAYSLRCMPQVHGAYRDGLTYVRTTLEAELGSSVDNPSVLVERSEVLGGGNFHGEALALALDHLGLCAAGFATIAERRIARLVDSDLNNGLPAFLTADPGRRSGFMLAQYTAASLVSENRSLLFPASSDSIPTSAGQEDHVSMGATSGRKARTIIENATAVIACEALAAAQGLDLRAPLDPSPATAAACLAVRALSPHLDADRSLSDDIENVRSMIARGELSAAVEGVLDPLG